MGAELQALDTSAFRWANGSFASPVMDVLMPFASSPWPWVTFGVAMLLYAAVARTKKAVGLCLMALICVGLSDLASTYVFKPFFDRLRPCYMLESVRLVVDKCGGNLGLPSGHSTNAMALAVLFSFIVPRRWSWIGYALALVIGFSRVYVGVHFPGDVLGGFAVGAAVAAVYTLSIRRISQKLGMPTAAGVASVRSLSDVIERGPRP